MSLWPECPLHELQVADMSSWREFQEQTNCNPIVECDFRQSGCSALLIITSLEYTGVSYTVHTQCGFTVAHNYITDKRGWIAIIDRVLVLSYLERVLGCSVAMFLSLQSHTAHPHMSPVSPYSHSHTLAQRDTPLEGRGVGHP